MDHNCYAWTAYLLCCFALLADPVNSVARFKRHDKRWSYIDPNGPSSWGSTCETGTRQSPINIVTNKTQETSLEPFSFDESYTTAITLEAMNNGHTLMATSSSGNPSLEGGGLPDRFIFQQLHFHWDSEHEIDGERAALELHMVHYNSKYEDIGEAIQAEDGLSVLAVLCDEKEEAEGPLEEFLADAILGVGQNSSSDNDTAVSEERPVLSYALKDFLPQETNKWFTYDGSLTTPECDEVVKWFVFEDKLLVSSAVLDGLRQLLDEHGEPILSNSRPVQKLNDRIVYRQAQPSDNEIPGTQKGSSKVIPKFAFVSCIAIICALFLH